MNNLIVGVLFSTMALAAGNDPLRVSLIDKSFDSSRVISIQNLIELRTNSEKLGQEGRGGSGTGNFTASAKEVFDRLQERGIDSIQLKTKTEEYSLDLSILRQALEQAVIVAVDGPLYEERENLVQHRVHAKNYSDQGLIEFSNVSFPWLTAREQSRVSIHELIGLVTNSDIDRNFQVTNELIDSAFEEDESSVTLIPRRAESSEEKPLPPLAELATDSFLPPDGWEVLDLGKSFSNRIDAELFCEKILASGNYDHYRTVFCTISDQAQMVRLFSRQVEQRERLVAIVRDGVSGGAHFSGLPINTPLTGDILSPFRGTIGLRVTQHRPIFETEPVLMDTFKDQIVTNYRPHLIMTEPRILNDGPMYITFDSMQLGNGVAFDSFKAAFDFCAEQVTIMRRIANNPKVAFCDKFYKTAEGKIAFIIVGKDKYLVGGQNEAL